MNKDTGQVKITNKKAFYDYHIGEKFEAGIVLTGAEVKSLRRGQASLADSFVRVKNNEAYLINMYIAPYEQSDGQSNEARRDRKLLLHKKQITSLLSRLAGSNLTVVPISCYNTHNLIKVELALARGKKQYDKRQAIKEREAEREKQTLLRGKA
jgi:SsrA-binding protein